MSATIDAAKLLRPGLLDGVRVVVAGAPPPTEGGDTTASARRERLADAVASTSAELGARVSGWGPGDAVAADVDQLVVDAAGLF
ncbi:MAG: hypothetical protein QOE67_1471, partial [Solirubrobacteraceae bacterium]|nr:hypothetical protein [Solirubrobacteraceae bacterium]